MQPEEWAIECLCTSNNRTEKSENGPVPHRVLCGILATEGKSTTEKGVSDINAIHIR